ncbi:hypothetical protein GCM10010441_67870 [Kitasatospora paracochleata]|uniref:DUF4352 domain-containing protein n=1 Tax=Kitasatospora paracochleata TaxID=58354 RepID=A0ABT1J5A9_9ACTN|nr:hypothetical protein [Kitasatospora paracochleata]MCP2312625.1 hypothetical protein [Kitasatospora paracochleata]
MSSLTRPAAALAAAILTAALATACDPSGDKAPANGAPPATTTVSPAGQGGSGGGTGTGATAAKTVQIGRTVYKGGLKFEVKSATYTPGDATSGSYKLVIDTAVTNTFKTGAIRDWPDIAIDIAGTPITGDPGTAVPPTPGATNPLPLTFSAYTSAGHPFSFDGASLVLGDAAEAQAVVPLGKGGREAVDLKPVDLTLPTPALTSGRLTLTLKYAQLRADYGDGGGVTALKRGQRSLLVVFDMKGNVGPAGMAVDGSMLRLRLPGGQEVGPTRAPIEAIYPDHPLFQNEAAWFVFDGATDGDYTLSVTDAPDAAPATAAFHATDLKSSGPLG